MRIHLLLSLMVLPSTLLAQGIPELPEPNETPTTATPFSPGLQGIGDIGIPGDKDWWSFVLPAASDLMALTGWTAGLVTDTDTILTLFMSDGLTVIASNDDRGFDRWSRLEVSSVPANTPGNPFYILEVKHFSATATGPYVLDLQAKAPTPVIPEAVEINDPRLVGGVATVAAVNRLCTGTLLVGGAGTTYTSATADYDFYQLTIPAPMTLVLETKDSTLAPATDTVVHLTDAAFVRLAFDDDSGGLTLSRLEYVITTPGTYYAVVSGYGATSGLGSYLLSIRGTPPTFVAPAGGCAGSAGTPLLSERGLNPTELPWLGTEFFVDETNLPAAAVYFRLLGLADLPTPFDLGLLGAPGCLVLVNPLSTVLSFASPTGTGFWGIQLPSNPVFEGTQLHYQLAVLDAVNALGLTVSNRAIATARMQ